MGADCNFRTLQPDAGNPTDIPGHFIIIGITPPDIIDSESGKISALLESGAADIIHLRHPGADAAAISAILKAIPPELRHRITLHDHFEEILPDLAGGYHLNSRHPLPPPHAAGTGHRISRSCHSLAELRGCTGLDYATLSPVFDSISKAGYHSRFTIRDLTEATAISRITGVPLIALGGVTPGRMPLLRELGFAGGAMLGAIWNL